MGYLILAWLFTRFFHYMYESTVAPELRRQLSERLRQLLAELPAVERRYPGHAHRRCVADLRESLESLLRALDRFGVVVLWLIDRESRGNPTGRREVEARIASLDRCDIPEVRHIRAQSVGIAMRAVAINNGGLLLYTLPVALVVFAYSGVRKRFSRFAMQAIDFHQQFGSAYVRVKHDVLSL
jgi:hypothetical protein